MALSRDKRVLLTLNAHSWMEPNNEACLQTIAEALCRESVSVAALQEVNQSADAPVAAAELLAQSHYVCAGDCPIREDNFALQLALRLARQGTPYHWTWAYAHRGYRVYEEGVAVFTSLPILRTDSACVSRMLAEDTPHYCRRQVLGVLAGSAEAARWYYSVHMGWWNDPLDPFGEQWARLQARCANQPTYLLGDFNCPAHIPGEGYAQI
ncbi:MAG: exodeoxyribonuclease III, partial [Clostridia bacterium]